MTIQPYTNIVATYGGTGLRFEAKISGRYVGINVDQKILVKLVEMMEKPYAGITIGHALWHYQNPDSQFPGSCCL
jgi:hypothetical protein